MTDRPIIFSGPMVRALLDGRKTQTRRLASSPLAKAKPGDRLYVREEWSTHPAFDGIAPRDLKRCSMIYTRGDSAWHNHRGWIGAPFGKRRPGMHMPRWASRLTLIVEEVRFQRLQEILVTDAAAEGAEKADRQTDERLSHAHRIDLAGTFSYLLGFERLWDSLHTKPGETWRDNPEIVALTFRVVRENIDRIGDAT